MPKASPTPNPTTTDAERFVALFTAVATTNMSFLDAMEPAMSIHDARYAKLSVPERLDLVRSAIDQAMEAKP